MRRLARPKKNRETNTDDLITQLIEAVTDTYLNPPENTADENGRMYLNLLAEEFSMTPIKVRKLLISSGAYQTDMSMRINELYKSGKTIKEIREKQKSRRRTLLRLCKRNRCKGRGLPISESDGA